jgi:hypothetical protein
VVRAPWLHPPILKKIDPISVIRYCQYDIVDRYCRYCRYCRYDIADIADIAVIADMILPLLPLLPLYDIAASQFILSTHHLIQTQAAKALLNPVDLNSLNNHDRGMTRYVSPFKSFAPVR